MNQFHVPILLNYGDIRLCSITILVISILSVVACGFGRSYDSYNRIIYGQQFNLIMIWPFLLLWTMASKLVVFVLSMFLFIYIVYVPPLLENHTEYLFDPSAFKPQGFSGKLGGTFGITVMAWLLFTVNIIGMVIQITYVASRCIKSARYVKTYLFNNEIRFREINNDNESIIDVTGSV